MGGRGGGGGGGRGCLDCCDTEGVEIGSGEGWKLCLCISWKDGEGGGRRLEIRTEDGFSWVFSTNGATPSGFKDLLSKLEWDAVESSV